MSFPIWPPAASYSSRRLACSPAASSAAATALWLGFDHLLPYLLYASLLGGALSVGLVWFRMTPLPDWLARHDWALRLHGKDAGVPYGIALAAAALAVYPHTPWMATAT